MKSSKKGDSSPSKSKQNQDSFDNEEEYQDLVQSRLTLDLSKLIFMLKDTKKQIKESSLEIAALRKTMFDMQEENENLRKKVMELNENQEQQAVFF